jgi:hypothetical protein
MSCFIVLVCLFVVYSQCCVTIADFEEITKSHYIIQISVNFQIKLSPKTLNVPGSATGILVRYRDSINSVTRGHLEVIKSTSGVAYNST